MTNSCDIARDVLSRAIREGTSIPSLAQIIVSMYENYDKEPRWFYNCILLPLRYSEIDEAIELIAESTPIRFKS